jgi:predicted transcriptional regulator
MMEKNILQKPSTEKNFNIYTPQSTIRQLTENNRIKTIKTIIAIKKDPNFLNRYVENLTLQELETEPIIGMLSPQQQLKIADKLLEKSCDSNIQYLISFMLLFIID